MKRILILFITILYIFNITGCSAKEKEKLSMTGVYFDTIVSIDIWGGNPDILDHCRQLCEHYEQLFSRTIATSEVAKINAANAQPVTVSDETADIIQKALYYCELSNGKFDITIAPLSELWDIKNNTGKIIPDQAAIDEAKSHVDYHNVIVEGNQVALTDPKAGIDLGAIAKGYIADQLKTYLASESVEHALINLGGNVLTLGGRLDGSDFNIGIQKPFDEQNEPITTVKINNKSIVSSGNYERYFEKDGVIYHHIIDPKTGYPCQNTLYQVTIISDFSTDGDALSTICFALGLTEGSRLVEATDGIQAIFVTKDYELHYVSY